MLSGGDSSGTSTTVPSSASSRSPSAFVSPSHSWPLTRGPRRSCSREPSEELALGLEELRELARGIHPAVLTDRGLAAAVEALAARATLPVELNGLPSERLPEPIEAAAYYVVSESLANVAKYAAASQAQVDLARDDGLLVVEVSDDGVGGADPGKGSGLRGLTDRVEALGGRLQVSSERGRGTTVRAELPLMLTSSARAGGS